MTVVGIPPHSGLVVQESPRALFRSLVRSALDRERHHASELGEFYLVALLEALLQPREPVSGGALGMQLLQALHSPPAPRYVGLRQVGDQALVICGLFAESLERSLVDPDYYAMLGRQAYRCLGDISFGSVGRTGLAPVFQELAAGFSGFAAVLGHIAFENLFARDADLLRLYRQWQCTRSHHAAERLSRLGLVPMPPADTRH